MTHGQKYLAILNLKICEMPDSFPILCFLVIDRTQFGRWLNQKPTLLPLQPIPLQCAMSGFGSIKNARKLLVVVVFAISSVPVLTSIQKTKKFNSSSVTVDVLDSGRSSLFSGRGQR